MFDIYSIYVYYALFVNIKKIYYLIGGSHAVSWGGLGVGGLVV